MDIECFSVRRRESTQTWESEEMEMDASEADVWDRVRDFTACGWWRQIGVFRRNERGFDILFL